MKSAGLAARAAPRSAWGQTRSFDDVRSMSQLPPQADLRTSSRQVSEVPEAALRRFHSYGHHVLEGDILPSGGDLTELYQRRLRTSAPAFPVLLALEQRRP